MQHLVRKRLRQTWRSRPSCVHNLPVLTVAPHTAQPAQTAEVKNGRLAMIGFSGMLHHALITHKGPIDQIMTQDFYPTVSTFKQTAGVYGY